MQAGNKTVAVLSAKVALDLGSWEQAMDIVIIEP